MKKTRRVRRLNMTEEEYSALLKKIREEVNANGGEMRLKDFIKLTKEKRGIK